jgi:hypothetical protein
MTNVSMVNAAKDWVKGVRFVRSVQLSASVTEMGLSLHAASTASAQDARGRVSWPTNFCGLGNGKVRSVRTNLPMQSISSSGLTSHRARRVLPAFNHAATVHYCFTNLGAKHF